MPQRAELASPCYTWQRPSASSLRRGAWRHKTRSWGAAFRATTQKLSDTHQQSACSLLRRSARPAIYEHVRAVPTELHTCLFPSAEKVIWLLKVDTLNPQARLWSSVIRHITHPAALGCALLGQGRHHFVTAVDAVTPRTQQSAQQRRTIPRSLRHTTSSLALATPI